MADPELLALRQEMTISSPEFFRLLPAAVGHDPFVVESDEVRSSPGERGWRLTIAVMPDLGAGLLRLPRLRVELFLRGYSGEETARFLQRFELHFRRGGG